MSSTTVTLSEMFEGPPGLGHGGHLAGHFAEVGRTTQVTLRRPTPLGVALRLIRGADGRGGFRLGDDVLIEAEPGELELDVPAPPSPAAIEAAEPTSPSYRNGTGVHPTCYGCGLQREDRSGLRIAAAPVTVDGRAQVAALWTPPGSAALPDGTTDLRPVIAALDCPGAFAFMVDEERPGLLGRLTFTVHSAAPAGEPHIITGWRIRRDGRRMFAGTALFSTSGELRVAASAVWFEMDW